MDAGMAAAEMMFNLFMTLPDDVRATMLDQMAEKSNDEEFKKAIDGIKDMTTLNNMILDYIEMTKTLISDIDTKDRSLLKAKDNLEKFRRLKVLTTVPMMQIVDKMREMSMNTEDGDDENRNGESSG